MTAHAAPHAASADCRVHDAMAELLPVLAVAGQPVSAFSAIGTAVDALGIGIIVLDAQGRTVSANRAVAAMMNRTPEELIGKHIGLAKITDRDDVAIPDVQRPSSQARATGQPAAGVARVRTWDGVVRWLSAIWHAADDGHLVGTVRDVTAEQLTLQELAQARDDVAARERRLETLAANATDSTSIIDAQGIYTWVSNSVTRFGMDPDRVVGASAVEELHPQDQVSARLLLEEALSSPGVTCTRQRLRWVRPNGTGVVHFDVGLTNLLHDPAIDGLVLNIRDVSDQVEMEVALRKQDLMFRALLTHSHDLLYVFDTDGTARYSSPSALAATGGEIYRLGDRVHPDDRELVERVFAEVVATPGKVLEHTVRILGPDGITVWAESRVANLLEDPAVQGIAVTSRDVTARHREKILIDGTRAALELAAQGEPLPGILSALCGTVERYLATSAGASASTVLLVEASSAGEVPVAGGFGPGGLTISQRAGAPTGAPRARVTGAFAGPIEESPMSPPVAKQALAEGLRWQWRAAVGGERTDILGTLVVAVAADRAPEPHEKSMLGRIADLMWVVAARDMAHRELQDSEARFRAAFQRTGLPTALVDADGCIEQVNEAAVELFGLPSADLVGQHHRLLRISGPGPTDLAPSGTGAREAGEVTMQRPDGQLRHLALYVAAIPDADGAPAQTVAHFVDITARRQGEEEVRLLNELLCQRISELDTAQDRLAAAFRQVTQARETERREIAHQLHDGPIQDLIATLWSLDFLALPEDDPELAAVRRQLLESTDGVRKLIFDLRPPVLDLEGLPAALELELAKLAEDTGVTTSLHSTLVDRMPGDVETMAYRTVREALQNVRKHARAGAVDIHLELRSGGLWMQVLDDGVGFDQDMAEQQRAAGHYGVASIRESIMLAGGEVYLGLRRDGVRGTELQLQLPLVPASATVTPMGVTAGAIADQMAEQNARAERS